MSALVTKGDGSVDHMAYIKQLEARLAIAESGQFSSGRKLAEIGRQLAEKEAKLVDLNRELSSWRQKLEGNPLNSLLCKAFDRLQGAVMIAYINGNLVYGNAAAEAMFGGSVIGQQAHHLFLDGLRAPFQLRLEDTQVNRQAPKPPGHELWDKAVDPDRGFVQDRVEIHDSEGEALDVALTMQLIEDQSGHPCFVLIEALDIGSLAKDELTKLFRREVAIRCLTREIEHRERDRKTSVEPLSVVFMDLDDFKSINSKFTDAGGDAVLRAVAKAIQRCIRSTTKDLACRWYSGDEFLAVIYGDVATAQMVAERMNEEIRKLVVQFDLPGMGTVGIKVTASMGVSAYETGDTYDELVRRATEMKTFSKVAGKGRVTLQRLPPPSGDLPMLRSAASKSKP